MGKLIYFQAEEDDEEEELEMYFVRILDVALIA